MSYRKDEHFPEPTRECDHCLRPFPISELDKENLCEECRTHFEEDEEER